MLASLDHRKNKLTDYWYHTKRLSAFFKNTSDFKFRDFLIVEEYHHLLDIYYTLNEGAMSAVTSAFICWTLLSVCLSFVSAGEIKCQIYKLLTLFKDSVHCFKGVFNWAV